MSQTFIQNLSDQVIRENHKLKNEVVHLKHKINNYEQEMITVITTLSPSNNIFASPEKVFQNFIIFVREEIKNHENIRNQYQKLKTVCQKLKVQNESLKVQIQDKTKQLGERMTDWTNERGKLSRDALYYKQQIKSLKAETEEHKRICNELKISKLKFEEQKNRQIQDMMLSHHFQEINLKTSVEKEHLKVERELRVEIESKNATIQQMSTFIQKIKSFQSYQLKDPIAIQELFQKLQKFNDLSQVISQVRAENTELRQQKKQLENTRSNLQAKIKELKFAESNLLSQMERVKIYQQEVEDKLMRKTAEFLKSQKEKEQMEKYYAERWNTEYKRVKNQLGKELLKKIATLEEQFSIKMQQMQSTMNEAIQGRRVLQKRNGFLQDIYESDQNRIKQLQQNVLTLKEDITQLKNIIRQSQCMNLEDLEVKNFLFDQERKSYEKRINELNKLLENEAEKMVYMAFQHIKKIEQIQRLFIKKLDEQKSQYQTDKIMLTISHQDQVQKIKQEVERKSEYVQQMKIQFERTYQEKLYAKEREFIQKNQQKDQENVRNNEKWSQRFNELEALSLLCKKRLQQEIGKLKSQIVCLEQKNTKLWEIQGQMKARIEDTLKDNKSLRQKITNLQKQIRDNKLMIAQLELKNQNISKELESSKREVDILFQLRKQWQNQLNNLEQQFRKEFDQLKKATQAQRKLLQQKIRSLEDMHKRKIINQRDYEQFKMLNQQKNQLKDQIHIKLAENLILNQVKDYYQVKLKQAEQQISKNEFKATHSIMARKMKKNRIKVDNERSSQKIFKVPGEISEEGDTQRYAVSSYRKKFNFRSSRQRLDESHHKQFRVKTSYGT